MELFQQIQDTGLHTPDNLKLHCLNPEVSHVFYSQYLKEKDEFKRDLMLEMNWTRKQKLQKEWKAKAEEALRLTKITKNTYKPKYVHEEINGVWAIHNKKLEEWIPEEQPI